MTIRNDRTPKASSAIEQNPKLNNAHSPSQGLSKLGQIAELLKRPAGVSIDELIAVTNWQRHSIRAAITKTAKTKLIGKIIRCVGEDGALRYRAVNGNSNTGTEDQK